MFETKKREKYSRFNFSPESKLYDGQIRADSIKLHAQLQETMKDLLP